VRPVHTEKEGAGIRRKAKCEAFFKMLSDDMPVSEGERALR